ncbi:CMRF35-like molecule 5 [Seriola aureovittata]|uniref:CMRF35-like molecule 5 n=1 Tax=Seriola aureovittata TaxID=2871759 RepID=UPI0024BE6CAE|nr:CMRF35-like molecule 5 [Seriola aureovittata]
MTVHLSFLLILTGLTGVHCVTTVSKVSVKAGNSITIPCRYGSEYMNNVKYLCKGSHWKFCSYAVKTNQPHNTPSLSVDHQDITGFIGESINISCYYRNSGERRWCRLGMNCVTGSSGSIDGTSVTISATVPNVFTVTMSGLKAESSGWYYCVKGELQMPVHVTVTERPTTCAPRTTECPTNISPTLEPVHQSSVFASKDPSTVQQNSLSIHLKSFIIRLSLLTFIVIVGLFIWFMFNRYNGTKADSTGFLCGY